jgi:Major tropism determinant N-terminal domain
MSVQVKRRRDTAANIAGFTPAQGEIIVDTTNNRMIVGDGATAGGFAAAKLSEVLTGSTALAQLALGAFGSALKFQIIEQLVTLSGATTTAPTQIPANCIVLGVGSRTVTTVTGATSYSVGVTGTTGQFGSTLNIAAGSTNYGIIGPTGFYSATNLIVTSAGGSFTGGTVRLAIFCLLITPPTS